MRVGQRLFLAVIPAVLGIFAVAALYYWGQFARVVPEWVVAIAIVAASLSLVISWVNTRYVATRIDRLAARVGETKAAGERGPRSVARAITDVAQTVTDVVVPGEARRAAPDELDAIEQTVDRLSTAVTDAEAERRAQLDALEARKREYARLVADVSASVTKALDEVRLPLHILLENRFGDLNENQEEMLGAASAATEEAIQQAIALREIADFDRAVIGRRSEPVRLKDVLSALKPMLLAEAELRGIAAHMDVAPGLPSVAGDRRRIQESVSEVLLDALRGTPDGGAFDVAAEFDSRSIGIQVRHGGSAPAATQHARARRVFAIHGATLEESAGRTVIRFAR
jgi:signal transduction histidine kinase